MAKRIIILERQGPRDFKAAYWADVPAARQPLYANAAATSAFLNASAGELAALRSGAITERVTDHHFQSTQTPAQIQTLLEAEWTRFQVEITAANPWSLYGRFWDGTAWTAGGVA